MRASSSSRLLAVTAGLVMLGACSPRYEIERPGTWQATGVNEANLRAMVADPRDLSYGLGSTTDRGSGAARAVTRVLTDRRRPLLDVTTSQLTSGAGGGGGDTGGALPSGGPAGAGQ